MDVFTIRPANSSDRAFIEDMLVEAANWDPARERRSRRQTLAQHDIRRYVEGWPRPSDVSVVAETPDGTLIGAAWCRRFSSDDPGFGFIDAAIPEVSIGVVAEWRGHGVGGAMLDALHRAATERGLAALSLSVERGNRALRLYERHHFRMVGDAAGSLTMRLDLPGR